tara:strand:+ start:534 stop:716 length:183 start_codon:yes stop_codon:yes gene_type:complete
MVVGKFLALIRNLWFVTLTYAIWRGDAQKKNPVLQKYLFANVAGLNQEVQVTLLNYPILH